MRSQRILQFLPNRLMPPSVLVLFSRVDRHDKSSADHVALLSAEPPKDQAQLRCCPSVRLSWPEFTQKDKWLRLPPFLVRPGNDKLCNPHQPSRRAKVHLCATPAASLHADAPIYSPRSQSLLGAHTCRSGWSHLHRGRRAAASRRGFTWPLLLRSPSQTFIFSNPYSEHDSYVLFPRLSTAIRRFRLPRPLRCVVRGPSDSGRGFRFDYRSRVQPGDQRVRAQCRDSD